MDAKSFLSISQLSNELDSGEAIIKFITKRFEKWVPSVEHKGQQYYSHKSLATLIVLIENINQGILPSAIEELLKSRSNQFSLADDNLSLNRDISLQERNVKVLEKNAEANTKISMAIGKNNEIETLKVDAINNIAKAINNINSMSSPNIQTKNFKKEPIDNLSKLIETLNKAISIDNLALLIDNTEPNKTKIDDLSKLIINKENKSSDDYQIDDLAKLLDNGGYHVGGVDDLSALIIDKETISYTIDDLSILINKTESKNKGIDDLSSIIELKKESIDDLSTLIDFRSKKPKIKKPECSPIDDFEKYKSEIISIIIDLKEQGNTEEETCKQFNEEGILTFSGKTKWSIKTISQIYQLIENAA